MLERCKSIFIKLAVLIVCCGSLYGLSRLYFHLTGGFLQSNIASDFSYNPEWETRALTVPEQAELTAALGQSYAYLGKGCQSYVFLSQDKEYVIKFFKYQRFRLQPWLEYAPPLPALLQYKKEKKEKKWDKLDGFVKSWKVAFEHLKEETGLVFVHLNKTQHLQKNIHLTDKLGLSHQIDLDQTEFCIQRKANMLCDVLLEFKKTGNLEGAQVLVSDLLNLILSEYERGLADNDHALMQNTGVANGQPIHIDVGQFVLTEEVKQAAVYHQELVTKTYKFKQWLKAEYPEMAQFLENRLQEIIGPSYTEIKPKFRVK